MSDTNSNFVAVIDDSTSPRLQRRRAGSVLTGVSSGIAAAFNLDVSLIRITWAIGSVVTPWTSIAYIALAFVLPADDAPAANEARPFFDGGRVIEEIKLSARALKVATLQNNQRTFRKVWDQQVTNLRGAWIEAIRR